MNNYAVIVAGGSGSRMQSAIPKQFLLLEGLPVLMHTVYRFYESMPDIRIILVLPADQFHYWEELCATHSFRVPVQLVQGGNTRFDSVKRGLEKAGNTGIIGVHDGVRPLLSGELITRLYSEATEKGNAVPCLELSDSLRRVGSDSNHPEDRSCYRLIQTPQCFGAGFLKAAYQVDFQSFFTDDASVAEHAGARIHLVPGEASNLKITTPFDLEIAGVLLKNRPLLRRKVL
jgi:2-C-methyl-D-erythritol 4-phosphate cytidylyltransferase